MGFSSKRGRPKTKEIALISRAEQKDLGTKELQARRARGLTAEPIDRCKEKSIIDDLQYRAALHFRWLYTIRFGAPGISALRLDVQNGYEIGYNNEEWQEEREREYSMAVEKLRKEGALKMVMNIAVFNHIPRFLKAKPTYNMPQMRQNIEELAKLRDGLSILAKLFQYGH